jgi:hypothetical protein
MYVHHESPRAFLDSTNPHGAIGLARVLYVHGLDGGPGGTKASELEKHFYVRAPQLSRFNVVADLLALRDTVRSFEPHVVVASSRGAMVALLLMQLGGWNGPAVLHAPATATVLPSRHFVPPHYDSPVVVLHGTRDETVSYEASRLLRCGPGALVHFVSLPGADHRANSALVGRDCDSALVRIVATTVGRLTEGTRRNPLPPPPPCSTLAVYMFVVRIALLNLVPLMRAIVQIVRMKKDK